VATSLIAKDRIKFSTLPMCAESNSKHKDIIVFGLLTDSGVTKSEA
jgi:hypothetical protein